jgi:hypothetical protein
MSILKQIEWLRKLGAVKRLQVETAVELEGLLPSILDKAFKSES